MNNRNVNILDCTLRDGGYYNNWNFSDDFVKNYLSSIIKAKIDIIEIGFRFLNKKSHYGKYAKVSDSLIKKLSIPKPIKVAVMINANEFLKNTQKLDYYVSKNFSKKNKSRIDIVRIAINFDQAFEAKKLVKKIKSLGYTVALNLMQSHNKSKEEYLNCSNTIYNWHMIDILYFADSLGSMMPSEVIKITKLLNKKWKDKLGIHTHNNKNLALINSLSAINNGCTFCDSTIMGMGRGAGNVSTESLMMELNHQKLFMGDTTNLQKCIPQFEELQRSYKWGSNLYYHFAANNSIHPTYPQTLLSDKRYSDDKIFSILNSLSKIKSSSFSSENLEYLATNNNKEIIEEAWNCTNWLESQRVLLLGPGNSINVEYSKIKNFIKKHKPKIFSINYTDLFPHNKIDGIIICNISRAMLDLNKYNKIKCPVIMPINYLKKHIPKIPETLNFLNYEIKVSQNKLKINETYCEIESDLTFLYSLCFFTQANVKDIFLAGFDGYKVNTLKQIEMDDILNKYSKLNSAKKIKTITKSSYKYFNK